MAKPKYASCPKLRWTVQLEGEPRLKRYVFRGYTDIAHSRTHVATGELWPVTHRNYAYVGWSHVAAAVRGCGVGTQLYQHMLQKACALGLRLASDTERSKYSEGFWKKQVDKGRATCIERGMLSWDWRRGWNCERYALRSACPKSKSLAGVKRKR